MPPIEANETNSKFEASENLVSYSKYGQYQGSPNQKQLDQYFRLNPNDLKLIATRRTPSTRLGMALQLCTMRFLGTFLDDPTAIPPIVIQTLETQLNLQNVDLKRYRISDDARLDHRKLILEHLGCREFEGAPFIGVTRMLFARLTVSNEPTSVLVDAITRELEGRNVVLPSITRILLLIGRTRKAVNRRLYSQITARLSERQSQRLDQLFHKPREKGAIRTFLELLRTQPMHSSSITLQQALTRIERIREVGVVSINLDDIATNKLEPILRHGLIIRAADLEKYSLSRRLATLLVVVQHLERAATDDALVVFSSVMHEIGLRGQRRRQQERLRSLKDLDTAALTLRDVLDEVRVVLADSNLEDNQAREAALQHLDASKLLEAKLRVSDLASTAENEEIEVWEQAHRSISLFLVTLLNMIKFEGTPAMKGLLEAISFVKRTSGTAQSSWGEPPRAFIPRTWLGLVFMSSKVGLTNKTKTENSSDANTTKNTKTIFKRHHYLVCVAHQLHAALKRGDVFVLRSNNHGDPRVHMLEGETWNAIRAEVVSALGLTLKPEVMLKRWSQSLDQTYQVVAKDLLLNPNVRLKTRSSKDGERNELVIQPFDALPESESLQTLKGNVDSRLPEIPLTEMLLEINARTNFASVMLQDSPTFPHAINIELSVLAVLIAEACNIGLTAVADERNPALKLARLNWVKKNYVHADTISRANVKLVEYHSSLAITRRWGGGEVASADGIRFVVAVKTIHAGANPKYFGAKRGITYYTLVSDQFTQLHGQVIPGTIRDSLYILGALLEQPTTLKPKEVMTDTGAYSDVIFGLFSLLGFRFSPRLKDAGGSRYWRIDRDADYGVLNNIARNKINTNAIIQHWEDILRLVGSLKLGKLKAVDAMRVLARDGSLNGLGKAVQEIGRIAKTIYLLGYVINEDEQRRVHLMLTHGETRHSMARELFNVGGGEVRQHYVKGMETQLGALGFVLNIMVLWNSLYTQAALELIEAMGDDVLEKDVVRLSPLKWSHIQLLGRYDFTMSPDVTGGDLRPLRDPNAFIGLEDEF